MSDRLLDLRGMRCPWPALRVARAMREGCAPIVVVADDPLAGREIEALAMSRGWATVADDAVIGAAMRLTPGTAPSS